MKNIVIVDIDGTIAQVGDRIECLQREKKDWDEFYDRCDEDEPIEEIIELTGILAYSGLQVIYCTGRRESVREKTAKWIHEAYKKLGGPKEYDTNIFPHHRLLMRKDGDFRHDTVVKPELLKEAGIDLEEIAFVLEDRNSMVAKWRELGLKCLQVADGDF